MKHDFASGLQYGESPEHKSASYEKKKTARLKAVKRVRSQFNLACTVCGSTGHTATQCIWNGQFNFPAGSSSERRIPFGFGVRSEMPLNGEIKPTMTSRLATGPAGNNLAVVIRLNRTIAGNNKPEVTTPMCRDKRGAINQATRTSAGDVTAGETAIHLAAVIEGGLIRRESNPSDLSRSSNLGMKAEGQPPRFSTYPRKCVVMCASPWLITEVTRGKLVRIQSSPSILSAWRNAKTHRLPRVLALLRTWVASWDFGASRFGTPIKVLGSYQHMQVQILPRSPFPKFNLTEV